jgi:uncharacterized membrane protein
VYDWWVFIHIVGVLGFVLSHGTSAAMGLRLRHERNPERIRVLLQISSSSLSIFYISTVVLLVGGIAAGIQGHWFDFGWIWTALATFVVTMVLMYAIATPYYRRIRKVMTIEESGSSAVGAAEVDAIMASQRPILLTLIGSASLLFIVYLMVLKPF